ncbi:MAG: branched-chain amino acid ABC transporter permease [Methylobacteriaceae bacterium]|nr:branched-chain amino acid ABC transporter permease [Methylobacteriaceae bacterium]MBV9220908.1 branched-chain amino acid ABC transporter permease [Methylobacteriaceae bacterium]MBV9703247.1 branched-chain amino acid ABC transporter permease [Methylobacteriaceae bacterium]
MNFAQVLVNSLITASELGIIAVGLTLTFSLLKFANFAHVETAVAGAYLAWTLNVRLGLNFAVSIAAAVLVMGLAGVVIDRLVFRIFRNADDVAPMIASLGLAIAIRYSMQAIFGPRFLRYDFGIAPGMRIVGAFVTRQQVWILGIVLLAIVGFHILLQYTTIGKAMRATSTNPELAQASGVNTEWVIAWVWFLGTAFAALGGALVAWDTQLVPELGFNLVIPVFCVVLIGGVGSVYGALLGALVVGLAVNFGVAVNFAPLANLIGGADWVSSLRIPADYKPAIVYLAVVLILLLRPSGFMRRELA